ncbi:MAG: RNA polymerase sigma factor [Bacteroidales bacterium]|nr:MAG: RNA polymerase sigma factor [Bacteroidales bacterium]
MKAQEFQHKVLPLHRKIYPFAFRILQNKEEAEDTVQEIFVKLWNMRYELNGIRNLEAFTMSMTRNFCLDRLKKRKTMSFDDGMMRNQGVWDDNPAKQTELKDAVNLVRRIINELPEQQRMIIQLRDIEGYTNDEITTILDISHNNLRVNLSRARQKIRENLLKTYNYGQEENRGSFTKVL